MTYAQLKANARNNLLRQISNGNLQNAVNNAYKNNVLTETERAMFATIFKRLNIIKDNWFESTKKVGLHPKRRCSICNKIAKYKAIKFDNQSNFYCADHFNTEECDSKFYVKYETINPNE